MRDTPEGRWTARDRMVASSELASRTRLLLKGLKCAGSDEIDYFEFFPLQTVKGKCAGQASAPPLSG